MLLGRNVVGVDLEEKFCKLMEGNLENVKRLNEKSKFKLRLGRGAVVKGDSRQLAQLLQEHADIIVTSPPYGLALNDSKCVGHGDSDGSRLIREKGLPSTYSRDKKNIGNLPHEKDVDAIITSPPYESSLEGSTRHTRGGIASRDPNLAQTGTIATIITSPPYEGSVDAPNDPNRRAERMQRAGLDHGRGRSKKLQQEKRLHLHGAGSYSETSENIGEIRTHETYLEAMLKVYGEMYTVLKPGGLAIIVLKNFVRQHRVVDLISDSIKLLEFVGFKLERKIKFKLPTKSFWRVLYERKWQEKFHKPLPPEFDSVYEYETILVFRKVR